MDENNNISEELNNNDNISLQVYNKENDKLDYTKFKLRQLIGKAFTLKTINALKELLKNYESRKVAIGWQKGEPIYIELNKN